MVAVMPARDNVRLLVRSAACLPGVHLPFFGGVAGGLFADHGLQPEGELNTSAVLATTPSPPRLSTGSSTRPRRRSIASGRNLTASGVAGR